MSLRTYSTEIVWTLVAICGGVAKHLNAVAMGKEPWRPLLLLAKAFISGFSGYMFAKSASLMIDNSEWSLVAAGVGGFLGIEGVEYVIQMVKQKFTPPPQ